MLAPVLTTPNGPDVDVPATGIDIKPWSGLPSVSTTLMFSPIRTTPNYDFVACGRFATSTFSTFSSLA